MPDPVVYRLLVGAGLTITENAAAKTITVTAPDVAGKVSANDLASASDASKGAGMGGFEPTLNYVAGTIGAALKEVARVHGLAAGSAAAAANTAKIQAAIDAGYGKIVELPKGDWYYNGPLTAQPIFGGTSALPIHIRGQGFDGNGGNGGTILRCVGSGNGIELINNTSSNSDNRIIIEALLLTGDGADLAGGSGIHAVKCNSLIVRNVWVQQFRNAGIYLERCFGSAVEDAILLRNRIYGLWADKAFNLGNLRRLKAYHNGRIYSQACGNVRLSGSGNENLGVVIEDVDVSYAGGAGFSSWLRSNGTLVSIVVAAGVATVNTNAAHGLSVGNSFSVKGATVAPALNTKFTPQIATVPTSTSWTFATTAPDGTYTESTLSVLPPAQGMSVTDTRGIDIKAYSEDCASSAIYLGTGVRGFNIAGGYYQNNLILIDTAQDGEVGGMYCTGVEAGVYHSASAGPHNVNIKSSITLANSAAITRPAIYMIDGQYYADAAPSSGTWSGAIGKHLRKATPTVGQPKGWFRTVDGTPGTWVSEGNL